MKTLDQIMEIDHVVRVHPDGFVTDEPGVYAPDLFDSELQDDKWELMSYGYTGQDRYDGPIMHDSEYIGGGLERDILAAPGVYVAIVSAYSNDAEDPDDLIGDELIYEGWAIAKLKEA